MLYITVAMQIEARPLISALGLKKNRRVTRFRVYDSAECALIVSGTGKVQSAISTTFLLTHYPVQKTDFFVNFGTCGTTESDIRPGTVFLVNRIRDHETGREVFPDLLYRHEFMEAGLETFGQPVGHHRNALYPGTELVDMEAYGAFESARHFLPVHRIAVIKVVLDCLSPEGITKSYVEEQVISAVERIKTWLSEVSCHVPTERSCKTKINYTAVATYLDLSSTLRVELAHLTRYLNRADPQGVGPASRMLQSIANGQETLSRRQTKQIISALKREVQAIPLTV